MKQALRNLTPNRANESTTALDGFPCTAINQEIYFLVIKIEIEKQNFSQFAKVMNKYKHIYTTKSLTKHYWQDN